MYCKNCGASIPASAKNCPSCGLKVDTEQPHVTVINNSSASYTVQKSKWAAFFLCFFLGGFGIHRFYVGKIGTGVLWLFTGGFFIIGWIVDLITILCGGFRDATGRFLV